MSSVNRVILLGRLTKDPETRTAGSSNVTNFSVATSESYKDKTTGDKKETTEFSNCVAWGKTSDIAGKYLHKGDQVYIEGKLKTRSWEKDGVTRYTTEIMVNSLVLLGGKKSDSATPTNAAFVSDGPTDDATDDLPF